MINLLRKKYDMMLATLSRGGAPRAYYTELEYLESTGTQYIDSGFVPSGNTRVLFDYKPADNYTGVSCIFGCQTTPAGNNCNRFYYLLSGQTLYRTQFNYTNTVTSSQSTPAFWGIDYSSSTNQYSLVTGANGTFARDSDRQTVDIDGYNKTVRFNNGNIIDMSEDATFAKGMHPTYSMFIFDRSSGGVSSSTKFKGKIYYFKVWDSGILVRDFIPVLDWNYVPCLYDKVTKQLFYNQGTGDFIPGREIHEVEYIESTGTQYIDTGFIPTETTTASISFTLISKLSANYPAPMYCGNAYNASNTYGFSYNVGARCFNAYRGSKINVHVGSQINYDTFYSVILSPTLITVKDVNGSTLASADMDGTYQAGERSLYLFTGNTTTTDLAGIADMKLYACQIWDSNILVKDFIPIVDENFNGYLFDKVNRKIYENAGTGSFIVSDIELEYIESTGTQYFDTGYTQTQNTELSVDCAFTDLSVGRFGCVKLVGSNTYRFYFGVLNDKWIGAVNTTVGNHNIATADYDRHHFDLNATGLYMDGELKVAPSTSFPLATIGLLNLTNATVSTIASAKLYSCTIGESGVLVKNYIPVIHNGVACLKNTIDNTYLTNAGIDSFLIGKIKERA